MEVSIRFFQSLTRLALAVLAFFQTHLCKQLSWRMEYMKLDPMKWLTNENVADCVTIKTIIYKVRIWVLCKNTQQRSISLSLSAYKWTIGSFSVIWFHLRLIITFGKSLAPTRKKLWLPWCVVYLHFWLSIAVFLQILDWLKSNYIYLLGLKCVPFYVTPNTRFLPVHYILFLELYIFIYGICLFILQWL